MNSGAASGVPRLRRDAGGEWPALFETHVIEKLRVSELVLKSSHIWKEDRSVLSG
jgi:hypothetical protein